MRRIAAALVIIGACAQDPHDEPDAATVAPATTTPSIETSANRFPTVPPVTTTAAPATSPGPLATPAPAATAVVSPAPSPVTAGVPTCVPPGDHVTTPSGRRVLLRVHGVTGRAATVVIVHGYTGTPTGIETYAEITDRANDLGITVAYPEGTPTGRGGFGWNTGASIFATTTGDDVAALVEMLDAITATGCVDPARITLVGESNGGGMALLAACTPQLADRLARAVLVNAAVDGGVLARCPEGSTTVPITAVAGALDETVPLDGGGDLMPVADWFAVASSTIAGCTAVEPALPLDPAVTRQVGTGCSVCAELLIVADGTHTWPGTSRGVSGLAPGTFDLNELLIGIAHADSTSCLTDS